MAEQVDVLIIGGAIVGASIAYFLKADLGFAGRVCVIERDPRYQRAATTLSAASIRQQFSTPANIKLSQFGITVLRDLKARFGADADVGFREQGYLLLATEAGLPVLRANHAVQQAESADIMLMGGTELARRFPWLRTVDLAAGAWGRSGEGWFDAHLLLDLTRRAARAAGAEFIEGEVVGLERVGARIERVQLADGRAFAAGFVVNAAGPSAGDVAAMAGIELPVEPRKRCVFVVHCRTPLGGQPMPLIVDPSGVYVRPEGDVYICGVSPDAAVDGRADRDDFEVDYDLFDSVIWPALAERIPPFEALKLVRAWAGHYDYNRLDQNAILGPHPEIANFLFANGFSGHGLQQAPGVGRAIAEWIVHGRSVSIVLDVFGYERVASGRPVFELNVI